MSNKEGENLQKFTFMYSTVIDGSYICKREVFLLCWSVYHYLCKMDVKWFLASEKKIQKNKSGGSYLCSQIQ